LSHHEAPHEKPSTSSDDHTPPAFISVHDLLLSLGELAIEAGLLNSALSRVGGDSEVVEKEMFCHFSLMIQLVAMGNDRRGGIESGRREMCLDDLMMLVEEEWLKAVPAIGIKSVIPLPPPTDSLCLSLSGSRDYWHWQDTKLCTRSLLLLDS
jgi:hypothetical protein